MSVDRQDARSAAQDQKVTLIRAAVGDHERKGTRAYDVYVGDKGVGQVKRYRERYPYKNLGGNVAMFRSRWSWRVSSLSRSFDTRAEAVEALIKEALSHV